MTNRYVFSVVADNASAIRGQQQLAQAFEDSAKRAERFEDALDKIRQAQAARTRADYEAARAQEASNQARSRGAAQGLAELAARRDQILRERATAPVREAEQVLGIRNAASVQAEIQRTQAAFDALKRSGTASAQDIARAYDATQKRVARLRAELERPLPPQDFARLAAPALAQAQRDNRAALLTAGLSAAGRQAADERTQAQQRQEDGRRFIESLRAEAAAAGKTRTELLALQAARLGVGADAATYLRAIRAQEGANRSLLASLDGLRSGVLNAGVSLAFLAAPVVLVGNSMFQAQQQVDRLRTLFEAGIGADRAGAELDFVRRKADEYGIVFQDAAEQYAKFAASTRGTDLEGQQTRDIFEAVAVSAAALNLNREQTDGILRAFQQIASKGRVQLEELSSQLGDRLPGVLEKTSRALGVTTTELIDMIQAGRVGTDALVQLARVLREDFGDAAEKGSQSITASANRFVTAYNTLLQTIAKAGGGSATQGVIDSATRILNAAQEAADNAQAQGRKGFLTSVAAAGNAVTFFAQEFALGVLGIGDGYQSLEVQQRKAKAEFEALNRKLGESPNNLFLRQLRDDAENVSKRLDDLLLKRQKLDGTLAAGVKERSGVRQAALSGASERAAAEETARLQELEAAATEGLDPARLDAARKAQTELAQRFEQGGFGDPRGAEAMRRYGAAAAAALATLADPNGRARTGVSELGAALQRLQVELEDRGLSPVEQRVRELARLGASTRQLAQARAQLTAQQNFAAEAQRNEAASNELLRIEAELAGRGLSELEKRVQTLVKLGLPDETVRLYAARLVQIGVSAEQALPPTERALRNLAEAATDLDAGSQAAERFARSLGKVYSPDVSSGTSDDIAEAERVARAEATADNNANLGREILRERELNRSLEQRRDLELERIERLRRAGLSEAEAARSRDRVEREYQDAIQRSTQKTGELGEFGKQAARTIQQELGNATAALLEGRFEDIGESFSRAVQRMAAEAAAANLAELLLGDFDKTGKLGGLVGSAASGAGAFLEGLNLGEFFGVNFATGGKVTGPGTGTSDEVPAMLSNGEWVLRERATRVLGERRLQALNRAETPEQAREVLLKLASEVQGPADGFSAVITRAVASGAPMPKGLALPASAQAAMVLRAGGGAAVGTAGPGLIQPLSPENVAAAAAQLLAERTLQAAAESARLPRLPAAAALAAPAAAPAAQAPADQPLEVVVNVINQGRPAEVERTETRRDGNRLIVDMVLREVTNDIERGGRVGQAVNRVTGTGRGGTLPR